jgi:hypothetical protein
LTTNAGDGVDVVKDIPQLIGGGIVGGNLDLELAALLLGVRAVVTGLVFCGCLGSNCGGLFEDCEDAGAVWDAGGVEEGDRVEGFAL